MIVVAGDNLFSEPLPDFGKFCREKNEPALAVDDVGSLEDIKNYNSITFDSTAKITFSLRKPSSPPAPSPASRSTFVRAKRFPIKQYIAEGNNPDEPGRLVQWLYPRTPVYVWNVPGLRTTSGRGNSRGSQPHLREEVSGAGRET